MRNVVFSLGGTNKKKSQLVSITFLKVVCKRVMFIVVQAVPYCIKTFEIFFLQMIGQACQSVNCPTFTQLTFPKFCRGSQVSIM